MKKITSLFTLLFLTVIISGSLIAQENGKISFLRPKQSLMSGGAGMTIQIYLNGVKIDNLENGMIINYTFNSTGKVTVKLQKEAMGSTMGAPEIMEVEIEEGKTLYYHVEAGMNDLKVEKLDQKAVDKAIKKTKNFGATIELEEAEGEPIIK